MMRAKYILRLDDACPTMDVAKWEKIENFGKSFDQLTRETVKAFLTDSKKAKFII